MMVCLKLLKRYFSPPIEPNSNSPLFSPPPYCNSTDPIDIRTAPPVRDKQEETWCMATDCREPKSSREIFRLGRQLQRSQSLGIIQRSLVTGPLHVHFGKCQAEFDPYISPWRLLFWASRWTDDFFCQILLNIDNLTEIELYFCLGIDALKETCQLAQELHSLKIQNWAFGVCGSAVQFKKLFPGLIYYKASSSGPDLLI